MSDPPKKPTLSGEVGRKEERLLRVRRSPVQSVWAGFGFFGLIGWSIVVPTLIGAALGRWLDNTHPGGRNWTLALLVAGLSLGCLNAWHWISKEHRAIAEENRKDADDDQ
jgi:ATP synthase protein I